MSMGETGNRAALSWGEQFSSSNSLKEKYIILEVDPAAAGLEVKEEGSWECWKFVSGVTLV